MILVSDEELIRSLSVDLSQNRRNAIQGGVEYLFKNPDTWRNRRIPGLSSRTFSTFREFILHDTPWGLAWRIDVAKAFLLPELPHIWEAIESDIPEANEHGIKSNESVHVHSKGNSRERSIAVLKRDAPEIAERVIKKEISAAEGMRQAGKREPQVTVKLNVESILQVINTKFSEEQRNELRIRLFSI
jgi:hypothetical protein